MCFYTKSRDLGRLFSYAWRSYPRDLNFLTLAVAHGKVME